MKASRFSVFVILMVGLAVPGCQTDTRPVATATATTAEAANPESGAPITFGDGPTIGSAAEAKSALGGGAPYLEALAGESYQGGELAKAGETYRYTITLDARQIVLWQTNWCATAEETLLQNLEHIQIEFLVDGEPVNPENVATFKARVDNLLCASFVTVAYDWPAGKTVLEINVTFDEAIDDGIAEYAKGTHTYRYEVTAKETFSPTLKPPGNEPAG